MSINFFNKGRKSEVRSQKRLWFTHFHLPSSVFPLIFFCTYFLFGSFIFQPKYWINKNNSKAENISSGESETLYNTYCTPCHGNQGNGEGELAYLLYPKPRNFTKGMFKLRSTPSGQMPTDDDLFKTVKNGMSGTAMPSFTFLGDEEIKSLVSYVKKLSQKCPPNQPCENYFTGATISPVKVPELLPSSKELIEQGKTVYTSLGCDKCHGEKGTGDGPSALTLKDGWGYPTTVRDFTSGTYIGGGTPKDLYLRFITGMSGTPMPSFESAINEMAGTNDADRQKYIWGLIHYIKSLEVKNVSTQNLLTPVNNILECQKSGTLPEVNQLISDAKIWSKAKTYSIPVNRLWQKTSNNQLMVSVSTIYDGQKVAIKMTWVDADRTENTYRIQEFQDGAAVQFSLTDKPGFHGMGSKDSPVDIWFWHADWQARIGKENDKLYAQNSYADGHTTDYPQTIHPNTLSTGRSASNNLSQDIKSSPVESVSAKGPGTLQSKPSINQNVTGKGVWAENKWTVVLVRNMSGGKDEVQISNGKEIPVAFAIWNGSMNDRNGQKMVSTWYKMKVQ